MKSLWNDAEAQQYGSEIGQRVYTSRLLGSDPSLVLHGGGNTSVKLQERNLFGGEENVLYVKSSGADLATIEPQDFVALRIQHLRRLVALKSLSDTEMARELYACKRNPAAPNPSVEAILHAVLPAKYVDHTHADALLSVMNTPGGLERVGEIYGDRVVVVPYTMPGFQLARRCAELLPEHAGPQTVGVVLMHRGLFTLGDTARSSYERMIELVDLAEQYLAQEGAWHLPQVEAASRTQVSRVELASLRGNISEAAGAPIIMRTCSDDTCIAFARREDIGRIALQGAATPDHAIRTKRVPMLGRDVQEYRRAYEEYFVACSGGRNLTMHDPAPRIVLDPDIGMCALGRSARDAAIATDLYQHAINIILRSELLEKWQALSAQDMFDMEYWELQQAKLLKAGPLKVFTGEVAFVTGAASGIGRACVDSLVSRGAAVVALDLNAKITHMFELPEVLGLRCDLTDEDAVVNALDAGVSAFGGVDMLVLNAGIFPPSVRIDALATSEWNRVMRINLDSNLVLMRELHPLLKLAPRGGRVAVIGSKNVPAPGPGAAAYSASKAAMNQLARVAALEWGDDGIRVNTLHPNAVFDTGIWTEEVLQKRAAHYKMTVGEYKTHNVLRTEVTSHNVAELAAELCGPLFAKTTGAQIPVDGGNERVI
ncbi:MAG: short-chain dehydrogenase [Armatimonadetes bacterium CG2_30_59_28]|nr:MAG: short-chain dehydrogenase [Armatimonadetes bacterium CG2_30_59_28]PIU62624.1 MAG: bifunctional aldolase/short-chain dehydrogenase [Armatimonadetes bacterium CG07_land_8_20_14_0_80_59_28]PIY42550.1 MAG: bifunctional aldolase/short-chain dehydrogenase [Armatimonadetes bacterium CG_4_10_14_3_um_filter_59_10]PJB73150.1 MAG: bifunctional aldolase/short-chain dehydrogenase [Armatimonadetes bacterium CG_4_9_14_3_um_filter_58_7]